MRLDFETRNWGDAWVTGAHLGGALNLVIPNFMPQLVLLTGRLSYTLISVPLTGFFSQHTKQQCLLCGENYLQ